MPVAWQGWRTKKLNLEFYQIVFKSPNTDHLTTNQLSSMMVQSMKEIKFKILSDGSKYWFSNGETHREDGPAIITQSGSRFWFINGKPHREDGPSAIHFDGSQYWFINGKRQLDNK